MLWQTRRSREALDHNRLGRLVALMRVPSAYRVTMHKRGLLLGIKVQLLPKVGKQMRLFVRPHLGLMQSHTLV